MKCWEKPILNSLSSANIESCQMNPFQRANYEGNLTCTVCGETTYFNQDMATIKCPTPNCPGNFTCSES